MGRWASRGRFVDSRALRRPSGLIVNRMAVAVIRVHRPARGATVDRLRVRQGQSPRSRRSAISASTDVARVPIDLRASRSRRDHPATRAFGLDMRQPSTSKPHADETDPRNRKWFAIQWPVHPWRRGQECILALPVLDDRDAFDQLRQARDARVAHRADVIAWLHKATVALPQTEPCGLGRSWCDPSRRPSRAWPMQSRRRQPPIGRSDLVESALVSGCDPSDFDKGDIR